MKIQFYFSLKEIQWGLALHEIFQDNTNTKALAIEGDVGGMTLSFHCLLLCRLHYFCSKKSAHHPVFSLGSASSVWCWTFGPQTSAPAPPAARPPPPPPAPPPRPPPWRPPHLRRPSSSPSSLSRPFQGLPMQSAAPGTCPSEQTRPVNKKGSEC